MKKIILFLFFIGLSFIEVKSQTPIAVCPQSGSFSSMTRGYYFTAQTSFTICGIYVEDDMSTAAQSVAIVRFTAGPPPAYAATTNNFVTLFQSLNYVPNNMIATPTITVNVGDIIGVYGSRGNGVNSYGASQCVVNINAIPHTLYRSGMQFNLATQTGMHDIWNENNGSIGRVTLYTNCCALPTAVPAITGSTTVCEGNTVTYSCAAQTGAISYNWTVPVGATINSGQGTNSISVTWNSTPGGNVCVDWTDNCGTSPLTCTNVTVNPIPLMTTPTNITVCNGANVPASAFTSTPAGATFTWTNSNTAIGLAASGTGNTPAFTATNTTTAPITSTITVTPTLNGCPGTPVTYTITVNPTPLVNSITNITVCNGANVPASAFSSTPAGATFNWTNSNTTIGLAASGTGNTPAFTATNTTTAPINSTVSVTPTLNGCVGTPVTYTITVNPTPVVNPITNITVCNGANVPASVFSSTPAGATFNWTNSNTAIGLAASGTGNTPAFTATNTTTAPITSTVSVTPTLNGCVGTPVTYTITVNPTPAAPTAADVTICPNNTATLTATAPGGTYEWFDAATGGNLLTTGASYTTPVLTTSTSYYVQTTVNGCVSPRTTVTVTVAPGLVVDAGLDTTICYGDAATLAATPNGTGYSYSWDENGNLGFSTVFNPTVTPTTTTTYYVTVTDANNCFGDDSVTVTVNPVPVVNPITDITICNGANVPASAFSSTPAGATFNWTNSNTAIGLAASGSGNTPAFTATNTTTAPITSTVSVTPTLNGCVGTPVTYTITVNPTPAAPTAADVTICPNNTATLTATAPGGTYEWFDAATGGNLLTTGASYTTPVLTTSTSYYVQTTVNGCVSPRTTVTVTVAPGLVVDAGLDTTICYGDAATLAATPNGTGYSYSWDENGNLGFSTVFNPTVTPTTTTTYYVTVTDANNCFGDDSVTVTVNPPLSITMGATNVTCNGACDGIAAVVVNGGTAPYAYSWSSGGTTDTETGLCPNLYTVTVTDALGCVVTGDTTITEPTLLDLTLASSSNPLCNGTCDGAISVTATGGTGAYQFTIDGVNFQATGVFNNLCAGNYIVGVVDDNTCVDTVMITLNDPALLVIDSIVSIDVSCNAANNGNNTDGSISIYANGGTAPLNYSIDNGTTFAATNIFSGLAPGSYTIVIEDANGCSVNGGNVIINEPVAITIPNVVTNVSCNGYNDGQIAVAPQGGTPAYSYSWSVNGVGNNPVANNLAAGTVTVTVSDANGCSEAITVTVNQPDPINYINFSADVLSGCAPLRVEFYNATDTTLIDTFYWDLGNGTTAFGDTTATTYTAPGTYDVSLFVTDNNGCPGVLTQTAYIEVFENPTANFSYAPTDVTIFDPLVYFTDLSFFNINSWQWNFANLGNSAQQHPNFTFPGEDSASYPVTLWVTNADGCTDSITKIVKINGETGVFVPNAFTPDFDNLNETFSPKGYGVSPDGYSFLIFDRWGEIIFESYIPFEGWNGSYKGNIVQNGTYVWKLNYNDTNGKNYQLIGKVAIIY